ncbi:MAG: ABC transporter permease [bacterium]|nr:ABC transporter permease [bacterium]
MNNLKLAVRGVTRNKRRSLITVSAIAIALATIVVINSFIAGTDKQINDKAVEATGHLQLYAPEYYDERRTLPTDIAIGHLSRVMETLGNTEGVTDATAQITFGGLATFGGQEMGGYFVGLEPEAAGRIQNLAGRITEGRYLNDSDADCCVVGYHMAELLGLKPGDVLTVVTRTAYGALTAIDLTVVGLAATTNPMIDEGGALMLLADAQAYLELPDAATTVIVNGEDPLQSVALKEKVLAALAVLTPTADDGDAAVASVTEPVAAGDSPSGADTGEPVESPTREGFEAYTWQELNQVMLDMIQMRQKMMDIIRAIMIVLAMAMIANTMLTNVFERTRKIGVLMAMGAKGRQVLMLFIGEAAVLGVIGSVVGVAFGAAIGLILQNVGITIGDQLSSVVNIPMDNVFYALVTPGMLAKAFASGIIVSVIAGLYPATKAARMQPARALRFI